MIKSYKAWSHEDGSVPFAEIHQPPCVAIVLHGGFGTRSKHKDRTAGVCGRNKEYLNRAWSRKGNSNAKWYNICNKRGVNWRNDLKNYSRELIENPYILLFYRFCLYFSSKRLLEILE